MQHSKANHLTMCHYLLSTVLSTLYFSLILFSIFIRHMFIRVRALFSGQLNVSNVFLNRIWRSYFRSETHTKNISEELVHHWFTCLLTLRRIQCFSRSWRSKIYEKKNLFKSFNTNLRKWKNVFLSYLLHRLIYFSAMGAYSLLWKFYVCYVLVGCLEN